MKLPVPYYSQFLDISDSFWMLRGCGAVSLAMVLEYHGAPQLDILSFCNEAKEKGGYDMTNGWIHDYLVTRALEMGFVSERKENLADLDEILASLAAGNPVIVSVEKRVLEQKRFHMLVVVGYEDGSFIYHEPESTDRGCGQYRMCDTETFMEYWRGKIITVSKS
jgi:uncharacterized protein YvpB